VEWICERLSDYHKNFSKDTSLMRVRSSCPPLHRLFTFAVIDGALPH